MPGALIDRALVVAHAAAEAARPVILAHFRQDPSVVTKADASPVTVADRGAEAAIRQMLGAAFPDHGILGEEYGAERADAEFVWVIDPIDGTKSFITGKPLFGTLIALCHQGRPILGVMDMPALDERWSGADGRPSLFGDRALKTRACPDLSAAMMYSTSPQMFRGADGVGYARLLDRVRYGLFGGDCHAYGLVAAGWADLVVEAGLKPYDFCALVPIVLGAGGSATDWSGQPLTLHSDGRVLICGDPTLAAAALGVLGGGMTS